MAKFGKLAVFMFISVLFLNPGAQAEDNLRDVIVVTGTGEVRIKPDIAVLNIGITSIEQDADKCYKKNNEAMDKIKNALLKNGIEQNNIKTSQFSIYPEYDQFQGARKINGFRLIHTYEVIIKDINKVGAVISAVSQAGANDISNIRFTVEDMEPLEMEARKKAVENAVKKAKKLSDSAKVTLGNITRIEDLAGPGNYNFPAMERSSFALAKNSTPPVMTGELSVTTNVTVYFNIK